jgi:thymidylate synthase (FAD)
MKIELLAITHEAERVIEMAGRTAYSSSSDQEGHTEKFVRMLVRRGHFSVLEHAFATLSISGVSRALTHQLVRHRLCSFTQQSQRYVNENEFDYIEPEAIENNPEAHSIFSGFMDEASRVYSELKSLKIKNEDARFVLPNAVESRIVVTANFREWRHIIGLRGGPGAQWEIRRLAIEVLKILRKHAPSVFGDFEIDEENEIIRGEVGKDGS